MNNIILKWYFSEYPRSKFHVSINNKNVIIYDDYIFYNYLSLMLDNGVYNININGYNATFIVNKDYIYCFKFDNSSYRPITFRLLDDYMIPIEKGILYLWPNHIQ